MESAGLGILLAMTPSTGASSPRAADTGEEIEASGSFAKLLSGADAHAQSHDREQAGGTERGVGSSSRALASDEEAEEALSDPRGAQDLLREEISAADALELLTQLELYEAAHPPENPSEMQLMTDIKEALSSVAQGAEAESVGAILAHLPSLVAAPQGGRSLLVTKALDAMQLAYAHMQAAKNADSGVPLPAEGEATDDPAALALLQSLQAGHFRRDAGEAENADASLEDAQKASEAAALALAGSGMVVAPAPAALVTPLSAEVVVDGSAASSDAEALDVAEVTLPSMGPLAVAGDGLGLLSDGAHQQGQAGDHEAVFAGDFAEILPLGTEAPSVAARPSSSGMQSVASSAFGAYAFTHAPVSEQIHVAITRAKEAGVSDSLTIQLDPADLGRVEVKMHTAADGQTRVSFLVDKAETLDALARDARGLERSLQEAGIKADAGGMQFNLRQQPHSGTGFEQQGSGRSSDASEDKEDEGASLPAAISAASLTRHYTLNFRDGVNIQA